MQSQLETVSGQRRDENYKAYFHEVFILHLIMSLFGVVGFKK